MLRIFFLCINTFVYVQIFGMLFLKEKFVLNYVLFDYFFIFYSMFCLFRNFRIKITVFVFVIFIFAYLFLWTISYLSLYDSLRLLLTELKPFIYSLIIYLVSSTCRRVDDPPNVITQSIVFLIGYFISITLQYTADINIRGMRPFVLIENNFESIFVMVVMMKYLRMRFLLISYSIIIGSISATVSSFFLSIFVKKKFLIYKFVFFPFVGIIITLVYLSIRDINLSAIDRLFFIYATFQDYVQRDVLGLMLGNFGKVELNVNDATCSKLLFYDVLKSGLCSPVLTHLFWSRIFLNFGLVGFLTVIYLLFSISRISYFNFLLVGAVALNGLSVSGFASGIIALTLVLVLDRKRFYVS